MVGTTRSRVNFFMDKFSKLGLIEHNGELTISSSLLSVGLHDWIRSGLSMRGRTKRRMAESGAPLLLNGPSSCVHK